MTLFTEYLSKGEFDLASLILVKELVKEPRNPEIYYQFCKVYYLRHNLKLALEALEMVERLDPSFRDVKEAMAILKKKIEVTSMIPYG